MAFFVDDQFTGGTSGNNINGRAPTTGTTPQQHPDLTASTRDLMLTGTGWCRGEAVNNTKKYYYPDTPGSADYYVESRIKVVTNVAGEYIGPCLRSGSTTGQNEDIHARYDGANWEIREANAAGTSTRIGSAWAETLSAGDVRDVKLCAVGSTVRLYVDSGSGYVERIVATTTVLTTGKVAIRQSGSATDTTKHHMDFIRAALIVDQPISPTGIAAGGGFGQPSMATTVESLSPVGIAAGGGIGQPSLGAAEKTISPTGIAAGGGFGQPSLAVAQETLSPTGIAASGGIGQPALESTEPQALEPDGMAAGGGVGQPGIANVVQSMAPTGIAAGGGIGQPGLATPAPVVTITDGPTETSLSVAGGTTTTFSFKSSLAAQAWKVKVVPAYDSEHDAGAVLRSGGALVANAEQEVTITAAEVETGSPGDGQKIIKAFAQNLTGTWNSI